MPVTFIDVETNCPIMAVPRSELYVRLPALHAILGLVSGEDADAAEVDSFVLAFTCGVSALDWDEVFEARPVARFRPAADRPRVAAAWAAPSERACGGHQRSEGMEKSTSG
jgi:hypothetical protein